MPEPDWKTSLRNELDRIAWDIERGHGVQGGVDYARQDLEQTVFDAVEDGYQRGLMAGRSQANYPTRRKRKEPPCAPSAETHSRASSTGDERKESDREGAQDTLW